MEGSQHHHLAFDFLDFVLIECDQCLLTDRQRLWKRRVPGAFEDLFDLLGGEAKTQLHLDRLHAFDGLLIEIAIAIREAPRAEQPFLFIVAQGADTHSCATRYLANSHDSLLP